MGAFFSRVVVTAVALWIVDALWNSIWVTPQGEGAVGMIAVYLVVGLLLVLVNSIVKPVIKVLALPLYLLTLGLFALVVNAGMLELVSWLTSGTPLGLHIADFASAVGAALVLAILTALISIPFKAARVA
ncbi:MAG: phage holin family protein [Bifidobacteriaceae bacterium]|jgi:putative membrane protein|nr:phage holin family protein [Bifidobacteriaceae bacterium]